MKLTLKSTASHFKMKIEVKTDFNIITFKILY
jgi:hypothetical protein